MAIQDQGDHARAEAWFRKALDLYRQSHGDVHPLVARSETNLATNLFRQGRKSEAADVQADAMAMQRRLGKETSTLLLAIGNVAYMLDDAGRYAEADSLHREYIALSAKIYGDRNPGTADARGRYCENLIHRGLWDEAQAQADSLLAWREANLPEGDSRRETGRLFGAEVALGRGNVALADGIVAGIEAYLASGPQMDPRTLRKVTERVASLRQEVDADLALR